MAHGIYTQLDFASNCMIYLSQKRKKKTLFDLEQQVGKSTSSVTQGAWFILRKPAFSAKDLTSYRLVPVCSNLLTTVQSIYHLPSLGTPVQ